MMTKAYRQGQILWVIQQERIHTQEQLAARLREMGIETTQVTLSRDIKDLRLAKGPYGYEATRYERASETLPVVLEGHLVEARVAQNLVVVKTSTGHAQAIAVALDREEWREIVGTIAGDDTILVVAPDGEQAGVVRNKLLGLVGRGVPVGQRWGPGSGE